MTRDELLKRLEGLDNSERHAALVHHVRSISDAQAQRLAEALAEGGTYEHSLGLLIAQLRNDRSGQWAALASPSRRVRQLAASTLGASATSIPATTLDTLDVASLGYLLRHIVRKKRSALAAPLVDALCARGRLREAATLLPVCDASDIESRLDDVAWPSTIWARLAKRHPEITLARIQLAFDTQTERPDLVWLRFGGDVWLRLAESRPQAVADLLDRYFGPDDLSFPLVAALPALVRWSPAWAVQWLAPRTGWLQRFGPPRNLGRHARRLTPEQLHPLCDVLLASQPEHFATVVAHLPYPQRGELFEHAAASLDLRDRQWSERVLAVLPAHLRDREAARMLELPRAKTDGTWRRTLLGYRSIEAARPVLERECTAASAAERAEAYRALIASTNRSNRGMAETLRWLERTRNDQDPVRMMVVLGLSECNAALFEDAKQLDTVVTPIFEARDTSWGTRRHATTLAKRLLQRYATTPASPQFQLGIRLITRLAGQDSITDLPPLHPNLPRGAEQAIADAVRPWFEADERRQKVDNVLALWRSLGKRAWNVKWLNAMVERLIWDAPQYQVPTLATAWLEDPVTRDTRVRQLVERDASALHLPRVFLHCHLRRQTWLRHRFAAKPNRGRFYDGKAVVIPHVDQGMQRWTPAIQQQFLDLLTKADKEPKRYSRTRAALVALRARVPLTKVADLAPLVKHSDVNVAEAALGAMVWTDRPAPALPILLDNVDGDRARVAMYALPRLAQLVPSTAVVAALRALLDRPRLKVTVQKEALRLLGQYPTDEAMEVLLATWKKPLHRDVKIAGLHAARSVLGRPEAWELLASAARDPSPDIARAVVAVPMMTVPQVHRARYVQHMLPVTAHPDAIARKAAFLALGQWWMADPVGVVDKATAVIAQLAPDDPWRDAMMIIAGITRSASAHPMVLRLIERLLAAAVADNEVHDEHDQVALQRLIECANVINRAHHPSARPLLEGMAKRLCAQPLSWKYGVQASIAAAANDAIGRTAVDALATAPSPGSEATITAPLIAAANLASRRWTQTEAKTVLDDLQAGPAAARVAAVSVLGMFARTWGWSPARRQRLAALRCDPDLDVQMAARHTWVRTA